MKILVVEDEFTSRLLLQRLLSPYGAVHVAVNGEEAIQACRIALINGEPYDLVTLDIMMPKLDGQAALREIRSLEEEHGYVLGRGAKVVMTSALRDAKNIMSAFREACDGYLSKPIDKEKLFALLRKLEVLDASAEGGD